MGNSVYAKFDNATWDANYKSIYNLCREAHAYEESGDNTAAVEMYAATIEIGERIGDVMFHTYRHAYDRIIALLRRTPDVVTLERYCRAYVIHPVDESTQTRINNIIQSI